MKLCVCVSGQVRGDLFELKRLSNQLKQLEREHDVTVILSFWNKVGRKIDGAVDFYQLHRLFDSRLAKIIPPAFYGECFWDYFPFTLKSIVEENRSTVTGLKDIFPNAIIDLEDEVMDLEFDAYTVDKNSIKMLYKRWRANQIKRKIEKDKGKFDVVLVTRPDVGLKGNWSGLLNIFPNTIYGPGSGGRVRFVNDIFAYGDSCAVDKYCSLFHKSISYGQWDGIHEELHEHLLKLNLGYVVSDYLSVKKWEKSSFIKSEWVFEDIPGLKDIYCGSPSMNHYSGTDLIISAYTGLYLDSLEKSDYSSALKYLSFGDLSNRKLDNIHRGRNKFVADSFCELCKYLSFTTWNDIEGYLELIGVGESAKSNAKKIFESLCL